MSRKIALVVFAILFLAGTAGHGQEWAKKMFEVQRHDFGPIAGGSKAEFEFELSNIYLEDVHISSVRSSCGCTRPRIKKALLKTYEKGAIIASINSSAFRGNRGATVTVTFDKPYRAQVQLHVKVNIRGEVAIEPGSVQLGSIDYGESASKTVRVSRTGRSDWKILDVKSANPHVSAKVVQTRRSRGQVTYDLSVHLDENAPAGYIKDHLMLVTNDYGSKQVPVLVEGRVVPSIMVSPSSLFMGVVEPGEKVTKKLVIRSKKPFRILSITCDDESFEFDVPDDDVSKPLHVVPVTFVAGANSGKVAKTIRIQTDAGQTQSELNAYAVVTPQ